MITVVVVQNPFRPQDNRTVKRIPFNGRLKDLLEDYRTDGADIKATVNGFTVKKNTELKEGDFVVIYPEVAKGGKGGKSLIGIVAAVALSVVAMGVGSVVANGAFFGAKMAAMSAWGASSFLAAAAVMYVGSTLVGRFMGQSIDMGKFGGENDPTYSWSGVQTMEGQNNAIPVTYGKVKSGGQTIGKYITTKGKEEYLNWLIACGEGELDITDIKLNDNPIEYYDSVELETRSGTNDQEVIPYFNDTYFSKLLQYELEDKAWRTDTCQGNTAEGLIVKIDFPSGLCYVNDQGETVNAWVALEGEYRRAGSYSSWNPLFAEVVKNNVTNRFSKEFRVDDLPPGQYEVRVRVTDRSHKTTNNRAAVKCGWTGLSSIMYDDFQYPNIALIGIRALATSQLSGTPNLTFIKERKNVWVWNSIAGEYVQKSANNPAWAAYDMVHQAHRIKDINTNRYVFECRGADKELMRYEDFVEWAAWCDQKDLKVNVEVNQSGELLQVVNKVIAPIGRGMVVRFGTKFGAIYSHVQPAVQMFGMGNIIAGSFSEEFLKLSDRANAVEVTYTNALAGYERDTLTVYSEEYDNDQEQRTAQLTLNGITDYKQAYREAMYQLYCNKYQKRTCTFQANIDSIACTVGDVVLVAHDVPKWANSGRIEEVNGNVWKLPVEVAETNKSYRIQYRTVKDTLYTMPCTIVDSKDGWTTIKVNGTLDKESTPNVGDIFDLATVDKGSKPFEVKSITRAQDFTRTISCIEYNENLFEEKYDIPSVDYSTFKGTAENVTDLHCTLNQYINDENVKMGRLKATWDIPGSGGRFTVMLSTDNGNTWTMARNNIAGNKVELDVHPNTTYRVKVITILGITQSKGVVSEPLYPAGKTLPPVADVTAHNRYRENSDGSVKYDIVVQWNPPLLESYAESEVWYKTNHRSAEDLVLVEGVSADELGYQSRWIYAGSGKRELVIPQAVIGDTYKIAVTTRDMFGAKTEPDYSPQVEITVTEKSFIPNTPDNFSVIFGNDVTVSWNEVTNSDIAFYEVRTDDLPGQEGQNLLARTNGLSTQVRLQNRKGNLYLYAKSAVGKYSGTAMLEYNKPKPPTPYKPKVKAILGGMSITAEPIPPGCNGMTAYINGVAVHTVNHTLTHTCEPGVYNVSIAYTDIFGEGDKSAAATVTVKIKIDKDLIDKESISLDMVNKEFAEAVKSGGASGEKIVQLVADLNDPEGIKKYSGLLQMDNDIALRVKNNDIISQINLNDQGTVSIDGKYIHVTGDTKFDENVIVGKALQANSIGADKLQVEELSALTAKIGCLRTADSGARMVIKDNLIEIFDENDTLRVRMGVWDE